MRTPSSSTASATEPCVASVIEVAVEGRRAALALSDVLAPYHSFLVQHHDRHWVVHARVPGCSGESLDDALGAVEEWASDGALEPGACRVDRRPYRLATDRTP